MATIEKMADIQIKVLFNKETGIKFIHFLLNTKVIDHNSAN